MPASRSWWTGFVDGARGLTTRGRCFVAAGLAALGCALVLGERDLLRVACLLLALPLVAAAVVTRTRYRLTCLRSVEPPRVAAGGSAQVRLRLENLSRLPSGVLLMEDQLPHRLGGHPRFALDRVEPHGVREVVYPVRSQHRGRYRIGPLAVRLADPFGLCELRRSFTGVETIIVTPAITALPALPLGGDWSGGGESSTHSVASSGEDDVAIREYRLGDDLRRVHWRSTAHAGELMVRREEQPRQNRATLLLDTRARAHRGDGPGSSFEWSVSALASIGTALARSGFHLRALRETGAELARGAGSLAEIGLLDALATMELSRADSLDPAVDVVRHRSEFTSGVLVAVVGTSTPDQLDVLARARAGAQVGVAVCVDAIAWTGVAPRARAAAATTFDAGVSLLTAAGWRVLPVRPGDSLAGLWPQAGPRRPAGALADALRAV